MGPSGCGKTYMVEKAASVLGLPFFKINAKSISNSGYVGTSLDDYFEKFQTDSYHDGTRHLFGYSIIFIDEIDKICKELGSGSTWNISLQYSLLKIIEGTLVRTRTVSSPIDTEKMLFVLAGNFEEIRNNRKKKQSIGFKENEIINVQPYQKELLEFGMVRELIGRISTVTEVSFLSKDDLYKILTEAEDSVHAQYKELFKYHKLDIKVTPEQLDKIIDLCYDQDLGARGLLSAYEECIKELLFNAEVEEDIDLGIGDSLDRFSIDSNRITIDILDPSDGMFYKKPK